MIASASIAALDVAAQQLADGARDAASSSTAHRPPALADAPPAESAAHAATGTPDVASHEQHTTDLTVDEATARGGTEQVPGEEIAGRKRKADEEACEIEEAT